MAPVPRTNVRRHWKINGDATQDVALQIRAEKLCGEFQPIK
jgi:hypothetical protein